MAHFEKAKNLNGNLQFHIDRKSNLEKSKKRNYTNNINVEKTYLNYDMNYLLRIDFKNLSTNERYKKRLEELKENQPLIKVLKPTCELTEWQLREEKKKKDYDETKYYDYKHKAFRKDANTCCYFVIQIPRDAHDNLCFRTMQEQQAFFKSVISFMGMKVGNKNIINLQVHMDEVTPHLHLQFIPTYDDKLNCKKLLNKTFLNSFHGDLQKYLEKDIGRNDFSILSNNNNTSIELKELKVQDKLENLQKTYIDNVQHIKDDYKRRLDYVNEKTNEKLSNVQDQYNNKIIEYRKAINKEKEVYDNMCLKVNKKNEEYKKLLHNTNESNIIIEFNTLGKDTFLGNAKTYSKEELNILFEKLKTIEAKYNYYNEKQDIIERLNKQHENSIIGLNKKINMLCDSIDKLESDNLDLEFYKKYVEDTNKIVDFNKYKSTQKIILDDVYGYENKLGYYSHHKERKIISIDDYKENQNYKNNHFDNSNDLEL